MIASAEAKALLAQVSAWHPGRATVYDGPGVELETRPLRVPRACSLCSQEMRLAPRALLDAASPPRDGDWSALVAALGLEVRGTGAFRRLTDPSGLAVLFVPHACAECGARLLAVISYGELQPGRFVANFLGVGRVG